MKSKGLLESAETGGSSRELFAGGAGKPVIWKGDYPALPMTSGLYFDNGNGTITDLRTNLTWQKQPSSQAVNWDLAVDNAHGLPGGTWRLPNVYELQSLVDLSKAIGNQINDIFIMPAATLIFWTSTTDNGGDFRAWQVKFSPGTGYHHNLSLNNDKGSGGFWWGVKSVRE